MDGNVVEHSDSDSGESWTLLENSSYADDAAGFAELPSESPAVHEKDEDTDEISIISDSEPDSPSPCQMNYETLPDEHDAAQYISVNPQLNTLQTDHESMREDDDLLGGNRQRNKTYVHRRNKRLSTVLNIVVMASVITAAGVAIGHMWGAKTDCTLHNTPGVNKILSNLYRLQEENAYLRGKLKEIMVLNNYQANHHKAQLKQNKCNKIFEESLHNDNSKKPPTTCVDGRYNNHVKLQKDHNIQPQYDKDFGSNFEKLKSVYQENRSWINEESVRRQKMGNEPLEKIKNPSKCNFEITNGNHKSKYIIDDLPEILENASNGKNIEIIDDIGKTLSYSESLKSRVGVGKKNNAVMEKYSYNKKQKRDVKINNGKQDKIFNKFNKNFNKRESDKVFEAQIDSTKPVNPRGEIDADIEFSSGNHKIIEKKINKRDSDKTFDAEIYSMESVNQIKEFDPYNDFYFDNDVKQEKIDDLPEILENASNGKNIEIIDDIGKTLSYSESLKSRVGVGKNNNAVMEKYSYNKKQKRDVKINNGKQDKIFNKFNKNFNKRESDKVFEAQIDSTKPVNPRGEIDADIEFSSGNHKIIDKKINKRDSDKKFDAEIYSMESVNQIKEFDPYNDFYFDNDVKQEKILESKIELTRSVAPTHDAPFVEFSFGNQEKVDEKFNNRDSDVIFGAKLEFKKYTSPRGEFDNDDEIFIQDDLHENDKVNEHFPPDDEKLDHKNTEDRKLHKRNINKVYTSKEEIDKAKQLREKYGIEIDSLDGDDIKKDNRYTGQKRKQDRKKYDRHKSHKKEKRRNKYEQWEMKGGLLKDYDDISVASSEESRFFIKEHYLKGDVGDFVFVGHDEFDKCTSTLDDDDANKSAETYIKKQNDKKQKEDNLDWLERRAVSRKEARRQLEQEISDGTPNTAQWHFRRMRKREQCRAEGDNSTYRKLSKRFKNFKTKH